MHDPRKASPSQVHPISIRRSKKEILPKLVLPQMVPPDFSIMVKAIRLHAVMSSSASSTQCNNSLSSLSSFVKYVQRTFDLVIGKNSSTSCFSIGRKNTLSVSRKKS